MAGNLNPKTVSLSVAAFSAVIYIICVLLFSFFPLFTLNSFQNMMHGIDVMQMARTNISLASTSIGFIEIILASLFIGWLFAVIYNCISKNC